MIKRTRAEISLCIIHKIGNKFNSGGTSISDEIIHFDEESYQLLLPFLLKPFSGVIESYRFNYYGDIALNQINKCTSEIFENEDVFIEQSINIATHLYNQSNTATIKKGDILIAYFEGIEYKDVLVEAIGVFKIENKINFFQTTKEESSFDITVAQGISTSKLDKGCLILNSSDNEGNIVLSIDNNNYDAQYWIKNFLNVKLANDKNLHTKTYLDLCKEFSEEVIKPEFGKKEQSLFLANTVDYFKENESLSYQNFKDDVFEKEEQKEAFEYYKKHFERLNDVSILNSFDVSDPVLKKVKSKLKSEIKLDTNIQIKLNIDAPEAASEYIEQGYDGSKKMKYYKVYFNTEK